MVRDLTDGCFGTGRAIMEEDETPGEIERLPQVMRLVTSRPPNWNLNMKVRRRHCSKSYMSMSPPWCTFMLWGTENFNVLLELCSPRGETSTETDEKELEELVNEEYKNWVKSTFGKIPR
jgi:hypothetical protein